MAARISGNFTTRLINICRDLLVATAGVVLRHACS